MAEFQESEKKCRKFVVEQIYKTRVIGITKTWCPQRPLVEWRPQLENVGVLYLEYLWALIDLRCKARIQVRTMERKLYDAHPELDLLRKTNANDHDLRQINYDLQNRVEGTRGNEIKKLLDAADPETVRDHQRLMQVILHERTVGTMIKCYLWNLNERKIDGYWQKLPSDVTYKQWRKLYGNTAAFDYILDHPTALKNAKVIAEVAERGISGLKVTQSVDVHDNYIKHVAKYEDSHTRKKTEAVQSTTICANPACGKAGSEPGVQLSYCKRCRAVYYCCRQCQKKHWKEHKKTCRAPQRAT